MKFMIYIGIWVQPKTKQKWNKPMTNLKNKGESKGSMGKGFQHEHGGGEKGEVSRNQIRKGLWAIVKSENCILWTMERYCSILINNTVWSDLLFRRNAWLLCEEWIEEKCG